jgi:hypothetical protein
MERLWPGPECKRGRTQPVNSAVALLRLSGGAKPSPPVTIITILNPNLPGTCGQKRAERDKQHNELFHIISRVLSMESQVVTNPPRLWVLGVHDFEVYGEMLVPSVRWRTERGG